MVISLRNWQFLKVTWALYKTTLAPRSAANAHPQSGAAARGQVYSQDLLVDAIMHQRLDLGSKFALDAGGVASGGRRSRR